MGYGAAEKEAERRYPREGDGVTSSYARAIMREAFEAGADWALREAEEAIRENAGIENERGICEGVASWPQDRGSAYSTGTSEAIEVVRDMLAGR